MEKQTMLVTQGLNELKLLDARIHGVIGNSTFVTSAKTVETKVTPNMTKDEFRDKARANYQSIIDLISRRASIKAAIVESNAKTTVDINGEIMTVAAAIEIKNSIEYEQSLLISITNDLNGATANMNSKNSRLEEEIDHLISIEVGKDKKAVDEGFEAITNYKRKNGEYSLIDPLNAQEIIDELRKKTEGFLSQVDSVLQISNCITTIEI